MKILHLVVQVLHQGSVCKVTEAFCMQNAIPHRWSSDALEVLEMGRGEQVIVDANNQAHQLDFNAEASSWIFMLNACEELLPSDKDAIEKQLLLPETLSSCMRYSRLCFTSV